MKKLSPGNSRVLTSLEIQRLLKEGFDALTHRKFEEAGAMVRQVLTAAPKNIEGHFLVGLIANETKDYKFAIHAFGSVTTLDPKHAAGWAQLARNFMKVGQPKRADFALNKAIELKPDDPLVQDLIGTTLSGLGDQHAAEEWYRKAVKQAPNAPTFNINWASSLIFLGKKKEAKKALDKVLRVKPFDPQAHWRLSNLEKATDRTHLKALEKLMKRYQNDSKALSFIAYSAGKEYEDLGEWENAFRCFKIGAEAKKKITEFDETREEAMFKAYHETFTPEWVAKKTEGAKSDAPIFILGQPRTGTTLVERIITAHSMVHSAGELQQFRLAIWRNAKGETPGQFSPEMVRVSTDIDPKPIGETYLKTSESMQGNLPRFVDKMPINYLYVPLIIKALPNAKIIHLVRDPMDSCFSSYKQLFAEAYFHSYSLYEMARHHVRYHRLMNYWRELLPGKFLDVKYEEVVNDLESNARRMINFLELPWEDTCLEFHRQTQAVTTASAVQVREKVHTRSVGRWQKYENQMQPVLEILSKAGVIV
ncbi:MAG: sulfotransferase [Sphingomonadales bacterium]